MNVKQEKKAGPAGEVMVKARLKIAGPAQSYSHVPMVKKR
jgi:hypothetical protein